MPMNSVSPDNIQISDVRAMLSDDFSATTVNRNVMAIKTNRPCISSIALPDLRCILAEDFSVRTINRVMMSIKCFCLKAYL